MADLLREALAEAKLVKKVSIEAAKAQLNEALTPRIESMLSKKLNAEIAESDDMDADDEEGLKETEDPGKGEQFNDFKKGDQDVTPDLKETEDPGKGEQFNDYTKNDQDVTPNLKEDDEMGAPPEETQDEDDLEIESILRELEDEAPEDEVPEEVPSKEEEIPLEGIEDEVPEEVPEVPEKDEEIPLEGIEDDEIEDESLPGMQGVPGPTDSAQNPDDEEEINVEALLSQIDEEEYPGEGESEDKSKEQQNVVKQLEAKNAKLSKKLKQYEAVVKVLHRELNEVNLLNTKLYYTTKMFKKFNVSNPTKMKIIETFDRANSIREIKLIYATLFESLKTGTGSNKPKITSLKDLKENVRSSSKTIITDRYEIKEAILSEGDDLVNRWKKLSGQKKDN